MKVRRRNFLHLAPSAAAFRQANASGRSVCSATIEVGEMM